jgi:formylglycine-generating enzyme required for sulfatase activity
MRASGRIITRQKIRRFGSRATRRLANMPRPPLPVEKGKVHSESASPSSVSQSEDIGLDAEAETSDDEFYVHKDGNQFGPHSFSELQELADHGELLPTDLAFFRGCEEWVKAEEVPGLEFKTTGVTAPEAPEEDSPPEMPSPAREVLPRNVVPDHEGTRVKRSPVKRWLYLAPFILLVLACAGIVFVLHNRIQSLEERLSARMDEWDEEFAFLRDSPAGDPTEANSSLLGTDGKATVRMEDLAESPDPSLQVTTTNEVFDKVINPDLVKLRELSATVSRSIADISDTLKRSDADQTERDDLLSFLDEFDTQVKLVRVASSSNEDALQQNLRAFAQTLVFLKKLQGQLSNDGGMEAAALRQLSNQLEPVKRSFQAQAGRMFNSAFDNYPRGEHVRTWTDQGGNQIKSYLWGYIDEMDIMAFVKSGSTDAEILRPSISGMKFSELDQDYVDSFLAWRQSRLDSYLENPPEMILIKAGKFFMGSFTLEDGRNSDETRHEVTISSDFLMGKFEVRVGEWIALLGRSYKTKSGKRFFYNFNGPFAKRIDPNRYPTVLGFQFNQLPATYITYEQIESYCRKLTEMERLKGRLPKGKVYRLPTEAEWEFACRAGTQSPYFWGNDPERGGDYVSSSYSPVGSKKPNNWGLHDMIGSAGEFLADQPRIFTKNPVVDPCGKLTEKIRPNTTSSFWREFGIGMLKQGLQRGFATDRGDSKYRSAFRVSPNHKGNSITTGSGSVGFRIVLASPIEE